MAKIAVDANTKIYVSTATATPFSWNLVGTVTDYDAAHTLEGANKVTRYWFGGGSTTTTTAGSPVSAYTLNVLYDPADTNGQNALRTAYGAGSDIEIAIVWGSSPDGYHETCTVTAHNDGASADGDYFEGSMSLEGDGTITTFTGGLPS